MEAQDDYFVNLFTPLYKTLPSDGGYWIPLLTGRETVVPPMVFTNERVSDPNYVENLRFIEKLNGDLTSPEGLEMLRNEGITHVYVGERGGPINPADLLSSPYFKLIYENNSVYIFEYNFTFTYIIVSITKI
jgi:hypothetical protein